MMMERRRGEVDSVDCSFMWDLNSGLFLKVFRKPAMDSAGLKTRIFFRTIKRLSAQVLFPHVFMES
jgi:hypothetical protein